MGGTLLEIPTGLVDFIVAAGAIVPDDVTATTSTEYLGAGAVDATHVPQTAVHISVTPRFGQLR